MISMEHVAAEGGGECRALRRQCPATQGSGPVDYGRIGQFKPRERVLAWVGGERTIRLAVFFVLSGLEKESLHWLLPLV